MQEDLHLLAVEVAVIVKQVRFNACAHALILGCRGLVILSRRLSVSDGGLHP